MQRHRKVLAAMSIVVAVGLAALAWAATEDEQESKITEKEVPPTALAAMKKLANGATLTQFSRETEHGKTYYECSWTGKHGNVDALVTPAGDLVELEEQVPADAVPVSVMSAAQAAAGDKAKLRFERKTVTLYEVKFTKGKQVHELVLGPDGRQHEHEQSTDDAEKD